jgi:hypothetical protein
MDNTQNPFIKVVPKKIHEVSTKDIRYYRPNPGFGSLAVLGVLFTSFFVTQKRENDSRF